MLHGETDGIVIESDRVGTTPVTVYRPAASGKAPVLVIAHGFAGSAKLMESFGIAAARNGYIGVTFDFVGHGRNPAPLTGSIVEVDGATRRLLTELGEVAAHARALGDGRLAVLGHSMASDIVVRYAVASPDVAATIAVSMFSPAVTATAPRNLLVITGEWEGMLGEEALRVVSLATAPAKAVAGVTYGDPAQGTARRAAISPNTEHASVLFSESTMRETITWLDIAFGTQRASPPDIEPRGVWIVLLLAGGLMLAWPLSRLLPVCCMPPAGANLGWRALWLPMLLPMIATPLILRVTPTHVLPVLVGDYLAFHFALYGVLTVFCLALVNRRAVPPRWTELLSASSLAAAAAVVAFGFIAVVWPLDRFVTSFVPGPERFLLIGVLLVGTLAYFLSAEWLTRGAGAARGAVLAARVCFLLSLAIAVALDLERLFFLIIVVPVIVLFFLYYGLICGWTCRRTGNPLVAGLASAIAFAWAIGVTFPLVAG